MPTKLTHEMFLERARAVHGDTFEYPEEYKGKEVAIDITCKIHDNFKQRPDVHLKGFGCKKCTSEKIKHTLDQVKETLGKVHNYKYDYSLITSLENIPNSKIDIICPVHKVFTQRFTNHRQGCGCPYCANEKQTLTKEEVLEKFNNVHGNKYDYSKVEYKGMHIPVEIICKTHGSFWQAPHSHIQGNGCKDCVYDSLRMKKEEFLSRAEEAHKNKYRYPDKLEIKGSFQKIPIFCPNHGIFYQTISQHLQGQGCPTCVHKISKPEIEVQEFVKSLGHSIVTNTKKLIKPFELDIHIPEIKKAIEFNGRHWHYSEKYFVSGKHAKKSNLCKQKGIKLLHIREDLWMRDKDKMKEVIIKFLNHGRTRLQ